MSPTAEDTTKKTPGGVARPAPGRGSPVRVPPTVHAPTVVDESPARERSEATDDKILAALVGVMDRLAKLESSQRVRDEDERMLGAVESGMFVSALGANMRGRPMTIDALGSPKGKPAAQPTRALAPDVGVSMFASLAPPRGHVPPQQRVTAPEAGPQQQAAIGGMDFISTPTASQRKLSIRKFDGTELYRGLGSGFFNWGCTFLRAIKLAESSCGFLWSEDVKVDLLDHFLSGTAERYYHKQVDTWWTQQPTLDYVMCQLLATFKTTITASQAMKLFMTKKEAKRTWSEHFFYMVAVSDARGGADSLFLDNIVHHASPELMNVMRAKYDPTRSDYLRHAEELAQFAQSIEHGSGVVGREVVAAHVDARPERRTCFGCGKVGHVQRNCRAKDAEVNVEQGESGEMSGMVLALKEKTNKDGGSSVSQPTPSKKPARSRNWRRGKKTRDFVLAIGKAKKSDQGGWILDSGASRHLVNNVQLLVESRECNDEIAMADGVSLQLTRCGSVRLDVIANGAEATVMLTDVYLAPRLAQNIVSYGRLERKGFGLVYDGDKRSLSRRSDGAVAFDVGMESNVLYVQTTTSKRQPGASDAIMAAINSGEAEGVAEDVQEGTLLHFHQRFAHLGFDTIERMARDPASGIRLTSHRRMACVSCMEGKHTRNPQPLQDSGDNAPIDRIGGVICSDLKGPMTPQDRLGNRYLINFVDHKTNYCKIFLARTKDAAAKQFEAFLTHFEKRFDCRIHVLRTDGGGEYANVDLFCKRTGVARQISEARNQASNGKAERMHRTILNLSRSMMFACALPLNFWGDAVLYAVYVLNRSPTRSNPKRVSPLEMLTGTAPDLRQIVVYGSQCYVYRDPRENSLTQRSQVGTIVGISDETKGYKIWLRKEGKVIVTQHVKGIDTLTDTQNAQIQRAMNNDDRADAAEETASEPESPATLRSMANKAKKPWARQAHSKRGANKRAQAAVSQKKPDGGADIVSAAFERDPQNYAEAMRSTKRDGWVTAMEEEVAALQDNNVWTITRRTPGSNALHTKWVYKTKTTANGELERLKARLVACGNEQVLGVDYGLTFAAVMDLSTVKVILALAATWGVPAKHGDIPNAYVKADKEAHLRIYVQLPSGMSVSDATLREHGAKSAKELVLELHKSLYGLKQAGRLWSQLLHTKLATAGFSRCESDMCLYWKRDGPDLVLVGVYVDDLLATGTSTAAVYHFFSSLASLSIKNLGQVSKFLGMRVELNDDGGYRLDQEEAIGDLLRSNGLADAKATRTPIGDESNEEQPSDAELLGSAHAPPGPTVRDFQSLVGSLLWVARCTRPDIAFAVHKATRQTHAPRVLDWRLAKRIARYLQGTATLKITMTPTRGDDAAPRLDAFSDADFAGDRADRKSMTGGVLRLNGMPVSWGARKQGGVSLSTMEAEFVAASEVAREMLGVREMLMEVGLAPALPMQLHVDNQAAISQITGEASSLKAKHVDVRHKFLCDFARRGIIVASYVRSEQMLADLLTKALDATKLKTLRELMKIE